jgi:hypothetical protein
MQEGTLPGNAETRDIRMNLEMFHRLFDARHALFDKHLAEQPDRQNTLDEKAWLQVRHWYSKQIDRERALGLRPPIISPKPGEARQLLAYLKARRRTE